MNNIIQKLLRTGVSMGAGYLGAKVVEKVWEGTTGKYAPNAEDDDATMLQFVAFTTISAGVTALLEIGSQRAVSKAMKKTGNKNAQQLGKAEV
ncbi:hypothetical protein GCM10009720_20210 [Yaniella flava]|uniref:DUF4235 domain-containing protein n=1 Tax=Yaniella flava TaxID=287930 RepID=A0ABP5GAZ1_9MICC|nr:DUF4235 domain-containing protein [Micrococcaceae bacterium]